MSEKEEKIKREIEKQIDESQRQNNDKKDYTSREITRVQAPEPWPDPPAEKDGDE